MSRIFAGDWKVDESRNTRITVLIKYAFPTPGPHRTRLTPAGKLRKLCSAGFMIVSERCGGNSEGNMEDYLVARESRTSARTIKYRPCSCVPACRTNLFGWCHSKCSTIERLLYFVGGCRNSIQRFVVHQSVAVRCDMISLIGVPENEHKALQTHSTSVGPHGILVYDETIPTTRRDFKIKVV